MTKTDAGMDWGVLSKAVGPRVRLLRNALISRSMAAMAQFGMPTGSMSVMALIAANPGCSQNDLARETGLNKSAVVGLLDALEQRGLAHREPAPDDRRRNVLRLREEGVKLMDDMQAVANGQENPIREELTARELATLISLLERANAALARDRAG